MSEPSKILSKIKKCLRLASINNANEAATALPPGSGFDGSAPATGLGYQR